MAFKLGYIGFGEAAYNMGKGLKGEGFEDIIVFDVALNMDGAAKEVFLNRAADAGVTVAKSAQEVVDSCEVVVLCVPAKFTAGTADGLLPFARAGQLFVDTTTALPRIKEAEAEKFAAKGAKYVDSAMLGSLAVSAHKVPMLASGDGAEEWKERMTPFNMKISLVGAGSKPGEASRLKLGRSVFMKGIEALIVESMLFARRMGIEDKILDSICNSMDKETFRELAARMSGADLVHSERRAFEVGEAMELMKEVGVEPLIAAGAKKRLEQSAAMGMNKELGGKAPKTFEEVFAVWDKKNYK